MYCNSEYVIFGTGRAAEYAYRYAVAKGMRINYFVDDFMSGEHKGIPLMKWSEFLMIQDDFQGILAGKYQRGNISYRTGLRIPLILVDQSFDDSRHALNLKRIRDIKDSYKGEECFILGNGPSLKISDLDLLEDRCTFASNKIYLAFVETDWRPDFYFVEDYLVARNNATVINSLELNKFYETTTCDFLKLSPNDVSYSFMQPESNYRFSTEILDGVAQSSTVVGSQLQFAKYMGFSRVYLLGVDFSFKVPASVSGKLFNDTSIVRSEGEINHFHPDYRQKGEEWSMPDIEKQERFFCYVAENLQNEHFRIYNASRISELKCFERVTLENVLQRDQA